MSAPNDYSGDYADLTREQLVERLRASECSSRHLSGILRAAPIGSGVVLERVFIEVSDAMVVMTGYHRDELLGQSARMLYPTQKEFDFVGEEKHRQIRERGIGSVTTRWRRKDGSLLDVVLSSVLLDSADEAHGYVFTAMDVSQVKHSEVALHESESFYRQTLESIPGMVFTTRPDGYCDYQSQQWVEYTGVPMAEHLGDGWNKLQHPDDRLRSFAAWQAAVEGRAPYDTEYRVRRHDGVYEWFQVVGRPIRNKDGKVARWFGVAVNIERIKHAEEAMKRQRDTLVREVHHRIKNHLQGITGLLRNRAAERPEIAAALFEAISQINTVAQVYGLQGRADIAQVRLCDLMKMAADSVIGPVAVNYQPVQPAGRAALLAQEEAVPIALVINELVVNAVKHLEPPEPARPVQVSVEIGTDGATAMIRNAPARLPPGFDFAAGRGCGTGLELVAALLPAKGAELEYRQEGDTVVTTLRLMSPVAQPLG